MNQISVLKEAERTKDFHCREIKCLYIGFFKRGDVCLVANIGFLLQLRLKPGCLGPKQLICVALHQIFIMSAFYPLEVTQVRKLTPDSVAVSLRVPEDLRGTFAFEAGQYLTFRLLKDGSEIRRAYSIASRPGAPELTVAVKKVPKGVFSTYANEVLRAGDRLEAMPPQGRFVFNAAKPVKALLALAAGSGITPVLSIIRTALEAGTDTRVVLAYGNRSADETMFRPELEALKAEYANRFSVYYVFSRSSEEGSLFGRIDSSTLNFITRNKHKDLTFDRYYLCGPEGMIELAEETLLGQGVAREQILHELFTSAEVTDTLQEALEGKSRLSVTLDGVVHDLVMDQKSLVLDAVLRAKIDAPYSCQGGVCSTCIARVTEGKAQMVKNQILTPGEIAEGLILTCQAHPTSPDLKIDYDDV